MDVRSVLTNAGLTSDHFAAMGAAISEGYAALRSLSETVRCWVSASCQDIARSVM